MKWKKPNNYISQDYIEHLMETARFEQVLDHYKIEYTITTRNNVKIFCPFHLKNLGKEDSNPSCSISFNKKLFHCWSCGESGHILEFVMLKDGLRFPEAIRLLASICGVEDLEEIDLINLRINQFYRETKECKKDRSNIDLMNYTISSFLGDLLRKDISKLTVIEEIYKMLDELIGEKDLEAINNLWRDMPELLKGRILP